MNFFLIIQNKLISLAGNFYCNFKNKTVVESFDLILFCDRKTAKVAQNSDAYRYILNKQKFFKHLLNLQ